MEFEALLQKEPKKTGDLDRTQEIDNDLTQTAVRQYWRKCQHSYYKRNKEQVDLRNRYNYFMKKYGVIPDKHKHVFVNYDKFIESEKKGLQNNQHLKQ
jgi:hypothetical protein